MARTRVTLQPRATRAAVAAKRAAAEADAKRAYPITPSGVALKNKSSDRSRDRRDASAGAKKATTAKTPKRVSLEALKALTGTQLRVFWPLENTFFKGRVVAFDPFTMQHRVRYEDGDAEWLELFRERVRWDQPPGDVACAALAAAAREPPKSFSETRAKPKAAEKKTSSHRVAKKRDANGHAMSATTSAKTASGVLPVPANDADAGGKSKSPRVGDASAKASPRATAKPSEPPETIQAKPSPIAVANAFPATPAVPPAPIAVANAFPATPAVPPAPIAVANAFPATPAVPPTPTTAPSAPHAGIYAGSKIDTILSVAVPALRAAGARGLRSVDILEALYAAGKGHALADRKAKIFGVVAALDRGAAVGVLRKLQVNGRTKRYQLAVFDVPREFELEQARASKPKKPKQKLAVDGALPEPAPKPTRTPPTRDAAPPARYRAGAGADFTDFLEAAEATSHGPAIQPHMKLSEEEAWACHSESVWEPLAPEAVRDAWVCCEAPGCGKWRRVPAVVAARVDQEADARWCCADSRDARFARCDAPQELPSDDIDERVALTNRAEEKRERKRHLDREYRIRKRARVLNERRMEALRAFVDAEDPPSVAAILHVIGDEEDAYVMLTIAYPVPTPAKRRRTQRGESAGVPRGVLDAVAAARAKKGKRPYAPGGFATLQSLWANAPPPRKRTVPAGLIEAMWRHGATAVSHRVNVAGTAPNANASPVTSADVAEVVRRFRRLDVSPRDFCGLRAASPEPIDDNHTRVLLTPTIVAQTAVPPGFVFVPAPAAAAEEGALFAWETLEPRRAREEEEEDDLTLGEMQRRLMHDAQPAATDDSPVKGWGRVGARHARVRGDRVRVRFKEAAQANFEAWRALPSSEARDEARKRTLQASEPTFLADVPILGGAPFWRVPAWTHPHWPLGGAGDISPPQKKPRKLPRVWRGKDLDMIVFGRDERLEWARKTGMFLARARTALGDRRLHRNAWGGSVLDSVLGAMLTQNVSDVLSSSAIMNLAARFPGEGATAAPQSTAMPEPPFEESIDNDMRVATNASAPPSAETLSVVDETVAALVAGAVGTAEAAAASSAVTGLFPGLAPSVNVEDGNENVASAFRSQRPPSPIPPELVSAANGASAFIAAGGVARPFSAATPPSTPAALPPRAVVSPARTPSSLSPPESSPAPKSGWVPYRKKTKDQIVREERLALAAKALLVPDPSPRPAETRDLIDWRAVMCAPLEDVVECIQCRGMHYMLAQRIQRVLRRVESERNGELSLEFLRDCPTDVARGYLLSMEGYGVKTVSCILLLALYRADFPVDVNVGRIMARLGWVPLETEEALEELSQYAPEPAVYKFLRERLNSFGLQTLFELHYHMITLGKVFCEKRTPNCAACPLRDMCEYASSGGKRQQKEDDRNVPEPAPARAAAVPVETAEGQPEQEPDDATRNPARNPAGDDDAAAPGTPAPFPANNLESVLVAGAAWDSSGRPPVGAPAVLLLDPGAGWAEARLAHARLSRAVHPDKCADERAARAFELVTAARNAMAPSVPEDDVREGAFAVRDEVVRVDADGEVVVGPRGSLSTTERGGNGRTATRGPTATSDGGLGNDEPGDIEDVGGARGAKDASRPDKGFARAAAAAAASHAASPLQLRTRPAAISTTRVRHELIAWSLPADMIPEALKRRAPDVDADCYLAVRCLLPSALAEAERAGANAGCEVTPLSILVPCRAAMYAKFPLHGTYFQTNELFLDARTAAAPIMVPARRLEFLPTVSVFLGSSVASICRGMSRAEVAAAFTHRAVCVRSWDTEFGGRPRPLPRWACPFAPKANTLGPAPGEERAFLGGEPGSRSRAFSVAQVAEVAEIGRRFSATRVSSLGGARGAAHAGGSDVAAQPAGGSVSSGDGVPRGFARASHPANAEDAFESDEDAMDERWDLFPDRERALIPEEAAPDGERLRRADVSVPARPHGPPGVVDPRWNVGVLAAFAARRQAATVAARKKKKATRDDSGPSGSGSRPAERRKREPNIQTFFSPAA